MAGTISDYLELELLDHVFKVGAFTVPTTLYIAVSTADPTDDGSGIAEPVGNGYARKLHDVWDAAASRASENTGVITLDAASGGDWGVITHWAMFDHISAGNMLAHGDLTAAKTINDGQQLSFLDGEIDISVTSGAMSTYLANKLLDHFLKTASFNVPTNIYFAACDTTVVDADTGSTISEPAGGSYARTVMDAWDTAAAGATENTNDVTFPTSTGSWGTIIDVALLDNATVGNLLFYAVLDSSAAIEDTDIFEFVAGAMDVTLD